MNEVDAKCGEMESESESVMNFNYIRTSKYPVVILHRLSPKQHINPVPDVQEVQDKNAVPTVPVPVKDENAVPAALVPVKDENALPSKWKN